MNLNYYCQQCGVNYIIVAGDTIKCPVCSEDE